MIEEIKRHVSFLRTGGRLSPGVVAKFAEFHRWALDQLRAETVWEPRTEKTIQAGRGKPKPAAEPLPPKLVRSERYLAFERLLVCLATIPRMAPSERTERAPDIIEACDYLLNESPAAHAAEGSADWQEATTGDWATWFDVTPRTVTGWLEAGKEWIKPAPSGNRGHYVVNRSHPEAEAKRLKAEKRIRKRRGS